MSVCVHVYVSTSVQSVIVNCTAKTPAGGREGGETFSCVQFLQSAPTASSHGDKTATGSVIWCLNEVMCDTRELKVLPFVFL